MNIRSLLAVSIATLSFAGIAQAEDTREARQSSAPIQSTVTRSQVLDELRAALARGEVYKMEVTPAADALPARSRDQVKMELRDALAAAGQRTLLMGGV